MNNLDPRLLARLARLRIATLDDLRAYLAAHPNGCEIIGRVDLQTLRELAEAPGLPPAEVAASAPPVSPE